MKPEKSAARKSEQELPETLSTMKMARLLGVPVRTLTSWRSAGAIDTVARGDWPTRETIAGVVAHLRRSVPVEGPRHELARQQARLKALQVKAAERELIPLESTRRDLNAFISEFLQELAGLPGRLASRVAASSSASECRHILHQGVLDTRRHMGARLLEVIRKLDEPEPRSRRR